MDLLFFLSTPSSPQGSQVSGHVIFLKCLYSTESAESCQFPPALLLDCSFVHWYCGAPGQLAESVAIGQFNWALKNGCGSTKMTKCVGPLVPQLWAEPGNQEGTPDVSAEQLSPDGCHTRRADWCHGCRILWMMAAPKGCVLRLQQNVNMQIMQMGSFSFFLFFCLWEFCSNWNTFRIGQNDTRWTMSFLMPLRQCHSSCRCICKLTSQPASPAGSHGALYEEGAMPRGSAKLSEAQRSLERYGKVGQPQHSISGLSRHFKNINGI